MFNWDDLIGHEYVAGRQDCYTCIRAFYRRAGLDLPNRARPQYFWQDPHLDMYGTFRDYGFQPVFDQEPEPGDLLLMPLMSRVNSHAAVALGRNEILHHPPQQLSRVDPYRPKWSGRTTVHARHPKVFELLRPKLNKIHFHEAADAHILRNPDVQEQIAGVLSDRD